MVLVGKHEGWVKTINLILIKCLVRARHRVGTIKSVFSSNVDNSLTTMGHDSC